MEKDDVKAFVENPVSKSNDGKPINTDGTFEAELESLINKHSIDNYVGTNDFIIANSVMTHIGALRVAIKDHDRLRGDERKPNIQMVCRGDESFDALESKVGTIDDRTIVLKVDEAGMKEFDKELKGTVNAGYAQSSTEVPEFKDDSVNGTN